MRSRRFRAFERLTAGLDFSPERPLTILDVGGTESFWEQRGWADRDDVAITLLNLEAEETTHPCLTAVAGDATALTYGDASFDVVHSNSVIEHLFTHENQQKMAAEIRRVGRCYWVQTPNHWFPVEPHFRTIGWQYLPVAARVKICMMRKGVGRFDVKNEAEARAAVEEIRLLSGREVRRLFPDARVLRERYLGLTKSFVAIRGFPGVDDASLSA